MKTMTLFKETKGRDGRFGRTLYKPVACAFHDLKNENTDVQFRTNSEAYSGKAKWSPN